MDHIFTSEGNKRHPTALARVLFAVSYMITKLLLGCSHLLLQIPTPGNAFLWGLSLGQGRAVWYKAAPTSGRFSHTGAFPQTVQFRTLELRG